jgi:predicted 3-demethylubiquinone-9 3-methyltransferase (glyoxalase superfamily)
MQRITPHLWFDTQAKEAAELYTSLLDDSRISDVTTLRDTPSGDCDVVYFTLAGQPFQAISAGPEFKFTPALSLRIDCATPEEVDGFWHRLSDGGETLMPLDSYPFSDRYGWCNDRFGLSWQIMYNNSGDIPQKIVPQFMFVGDVCGKAEEAIKLYTSVFPNSQTGDVMRYGAGADPDDVNSVQFAAFTLDGYHLAAMDSALEHNFSFNEAVSLIVSCEGQDEIDYYWERMSAVPEAEQCGWLKDRFGVSWQIVPRKMDEMMRKADDETLQRVTQTFLPMKKLELAELEEAYAGAVRSK